MDALRAEIATAIGPILAPGTTASARAKARSEEATEAFRQLERLVRDPFGEGPRALQEYWCAKAQAAGTNYAVRNVKGARWFKISKEHNERLDRILTENADWYGGGKDMSDETRQMLGMAARTLGPILRVWVQMVRPATVGSGPWTEEEARALLMTCVFQVWRDLVTSDSWMYAGLTVPTTRVATAASAADWSRALMFHARQQFSRLDQATIAKVLQQRAEMERTSVVEEFNAIKDDDERAAELIKKRLRIGRWALAAKGFRQYDADMFEFENEQRRRMGIVDAPVDPILLAGAAGPVAGAQDYGLGGVEGAVPEEGYDADQAADGDNY
jgi:hypothetical protein